VILDQPHMAAFLDDPLVDELSVTLAPGADPDAAEEAIAAALGANGVDEVLGRLRKGRFVAATDSGGNVLCRDLAKTTVHDLYRCLGLGVTPAEIADSQDGQGDSPNARLQALIENLGKAESLSLDAPIADIIDD
jgi:DNA-binding IscR family transcriptional regulator